MLCALYAEHTVYIRSAGESCVWIIESQLGFRKESFRSSQQSVESHGVIDELLHLNEPILIVQTQVQSRDL